MPQHEPCAVCGSTQMHVVDGMLYCVRCSTQNMTFQEYDQDDDQALNFMGKITVKKTRKIVDLNATPTNVDVEMGLVTPNLKPKAAPNEEKDASGRVRKRKVQAQPGDSSELRSDHSVGSSHAPSYLRNVGIRIMSFTKLVAKASFMMKVDLGYPEDYPNQCFAVWQRYLAHCDVAFSDKEFTEDLEQMYRAMVFNRNIAFERATIKKKKLDAKRSRAKKKLAQSQDAWNLLMSDTINADLEMSESDEGEVEDELTEEQLEAAAKRKSTANLINMVDTKISNLTILMACRIYLDMDVLTAILYISAMTLGCGWTMLSDIVRWIREDRGSIAGCQSRALGGTKTLAGKRKKAFFAEMDLPLYEFYRTSLWIWQSLQIPAQAPVDYEQLLARMMYNLNLPTELMERVLYLMNLAPPTLGMDMASLAQQGDVNEGMTCRAYCDSAQKPYRKVLECFGRPRTGVQNSWNSDVFFATETKLMCYILLALKLMFGLDDDREQRMEPSAPNRDDEEESFNVVDWMRQLKMRLMLWEGHAVPDILQKHKPVFPLIAEPFFGHGRNSKLSRNTVEGKRYYCIVTRMRDRGFNDCVPHTMSRQSAVTLPSPFSEDVLSRAPNKNDDDAVYAPLRTQADVVREYMLLKRTDEQRNELKAEISDESLRLVKANFDSRSLEYKPVAPVAEPESFLRQVESTDFVGTAEDRKRWRRMFPCANGYVRYPRPLWAHGGVLYSKEEDDRMRRQNLRQREGGNLLCGPRRFFASRKNAVDAAEAALPYMSGSFRFLWQAFAKIIGDSDFVLYTAFMMLELQIIDRQKFQKCAKAMVDGATHPVDFLNFKDDGSSTHHTVRVSSFHDITRPQQLSRVQFGLPRNWDLDIWDLENEEQDDWMVSSSEDESEDESEEKENQTDSGEELDQATVELEHTSLSDAVGPFRDGGCQNEPAGQTEFESQHNTGEPGYNRLYYDKHVFDWDAMWNLITMRYW